MPQISIASRRRWSVTSRAVAGTLGAYGLTSLVTVVLSFALQGMMTAVEAVTAATLASFAVFAIVAIAVFHTRSAARAWTGLAIGAVPLGLAVLAFREIAG